MSELDRSSALQQGTREFAGLYERNAYLVYNLALRVTVDRAAAIETACAAFLASLGSDDDDAELPRLTVRRALPLARQTPTAEAAGDADAQAMLRASASLAPPERAALALAGLSGADATRIGATLEITVEAAESLLERAWSAFAAAARLPREPAQEAYQGWLWAEPAPEVWEQLYPSFYAELIRRLNATEAVQGVGGSMATAVAAAASRPSWRERRRARRAEKDARRFKPPGRVRRAARAIPVGRLVLLVGLGAAGAGTAYATGMIGASHHTSTSPLVFAAPKQKLTPAEIARLRAEERQASREYAAQQRLAARQARLQQLLALKAFRQQRAQQLAAERAAGKSRQAALKRAREFAARQRALQAQLLSQAQQQQQTTTPAYSTTPTRTSRSTPQRNSTQTSSGSPTPTQAQQQCLYDQNNGTYVCPQN